MASKLAHAGIETVVCGPGDIAQAHTSDEFIVVGQVEKPSVYTHASGCAVASDFSGRRQEKLLKTD